MFYGEVAKLLLTDRGSLSIIGQLIMYALRVSAVACERTLSQLARQAVLFLVHLKPFYPNTGTVENCSLIHIVESKIANIMIPFFGTVHYLYYTFILFVVDVIIALIITKCNPLKEAFILPSSDMKRRLNHIRKYPDLYGQAQKREAKDIL